MTITFCNPGQPCLDGKVCDQPELNYGGKGNPDGLVFAAFGKASRCHPGFSKSGACEDFKSSKNTSS